MAESLLIRTPIIKLAEDSDEYRELTNAIDSLPLDEMSTEDLCRLMKHHFGNTGSVRRWRIYNRAYHRLVDLVRVRKRQEVYNRKKMAQPSSSNELPEDIDEIVPYMEGFKRDDLVPPGCRTAREDKPGDGDVWRPLRVFGSPPVATFFRGSIDSTKSLKPVTPGKQMRRQCVKENRWFRERVRKGRAANVGQLKAASRQRIARAALLDIIASAPGIRVFKRLGGFITVVKDGIYYTAELTKVRAEQYEEDVPRVHDEDIDDDGPEGEDEVEDDKDLSD